MFEVLINGKLPAGIKKSEIETLASVAWKHAGGNGAAAMSISIIGDRKMRSLNRQYRGKDKTTDVLSFGFISTGGGTRSSPRFAASKQMAAKVAPIGSRRQSNEPVQLGDIFISLPQVRRQAKAIQRPVITEFALMVVHGTLHLMGHDHETLAQERRMFGLQHDILSKKGYL